VVVTFELLEGRIHGARYYTARPNFGAHIETWFRSDWNEMIEWSVKTYGPTPEDGVWTPSARWYANNAKFWFRDEQDRTAFLLKWA
jgi:hypothetical protein